MSHYLVRAARTAVRGLSFAGFRLRGRDAAGGIYPSDRPEGWRVGLAPDRVIVIGEATAMGYGVRTHELGLAAQFARHLSASTGRGCEWSAVAIPGNRIRSAVKVVRSNRTPVARADYVILMLGIVDTLSLTTCASWGKHLAATLDALLEELSTDAVILVPLTPPLSKVGAIPTLERWASTHQSTLLNTTTIEVVAARPQCEVVEFPAGLYQELWKPETPPAQYGALYDEWADALVNVALAVRQT
jgi:hypothetical protein